MRALALSPQLVGILAMSAAGAIFSAHDAITKFLAPSVPIGEIIFFRQLSATLFLTIYVLMTSGLRELKPISKGKQTIRAGLFVVSTTLIAISVSVLPLATALAIIFASPLLVAALSATLLAEPVGPRRWTAIILGFIGVLIIVRPTDASFSWLLLIPVAAASASALRDITTRILHRTDNTNAILFWSNIAIMLAMLCSIPYGGKALPFETMALLVVAGALNLLAHFLTITALRFGDAALVTPFRYTSLIWAALLGYLIWSDIPDESTITGSVVIVAAGVYLVLRGAQVKSQAGESEAPAQKSSTN